MKNKNLLIGLGVLAVAGIGYYMWKKKSEKTSSACGCSGFCGDEYSNAVAKDKPTRSAGTGKTWCCAEYNTANECSQWESRDLGSPCGGETYFTTRGGTRPNIFQKQTLTRFR
jgi:hypothetical protein